MRAAVSAAVLAMLALASCGGDPAPMEEPTVRLTFVDRLGEMREPVEDGNWNVIQVRDAHGEQLEKFEWGPNPDGITKSIALAEGTYRIRAESLDYFAAEHGKLVEGCELGLDLDPAVAEEAVVSIDRDWYGNCYIARDPSLCPQPATRVPDKDLIAYAESALVGLRTAVAKRIASAGNCSVAAVSIDGEPQPLTREYDPTRIQVDVEDGEVVRVRGFG